MELSTRDRRLLAALEGGLPRVPRPYQALAESAGMSEGEVLAALARLQDQGVIKRQGLIVRHHELGYLANAMVVFDVLDEAVDEIGRAMAAFPEVTLCYRRTRRLPVWPYNLYCMVHGRERTSVLARIEAITGTLGLEGRPRAILFSSRRFKQRGARYFALEPEAAG